MSLTHNSPFQRSCLHHPATSSMRSVTEYSYYSTISQLPFFLFSSSQFLEGEALEFLSEKLEEPKEGEFSGGNCTILIKD